LDQIPSISLLALPPVAMTARQMTDGHAVRDPRTATWARRGNPLALLMPADGLQRM